MSEVRSLLSALGVGALLLSQCAQAWERPGHFDDPRVTGCYVPMCSQEARAAEAIAGAIRQQPPVVIEIRQPRKPSSRTRAVQTVNCNHILDHQSMLACSQSDAKAYDVSKTLAPTIDLNQKELDHGNTKEKTH